MSLLSSSSKVSSLSNPSDSETAKFFQLAQFCEREGYSIYELQERSIGEFMNDGDAIEVVELRFNFFEKIRLNRIKKLKRFAFPMEGRRN